MDRLCPFCGGAARAQAHFCPQCGSRLDARLAPGTELKGGDYVIIRPLTRGGMGDVYLARDRCAFEREVVIKQMLDYFDLARPEERAVAHQRFEEEGRTLATLKHPGVPQIYTFFSENGRYYIVMELILGEPLESYVTHEDDQGRTVPRRMLPMEDVLRYIIQVCRILEYLHGRARPVVHGDVKPANLIVESQLGIVRLVDFGAASVWRDAEGNGTPESPARSQGGAPEASGSEGAYGTDGYAAPEQYRGRAVPRSDVFGLAATAYHLLTDDDPREHPFKWPRMERLPKELRLALERCLRPEPEKRSTVAELHQALEAFATPKRALEAFTFPGGAQIRSVSALPALSDEHWDAARSFLYKGDFGRWLRDINRLDLVLAAEEITSTESNQDAGLEQFLNVVDPGIAQPRVVADPERVDLGAVAREAGLIRPITLHNDTRGYTIATLGASQSWLEVTPAKANLWAGVPVEVHAHVHAEGFPFRSQQQGEVTVYSQGSRTLTIPVTARVSLWREGWRIVRRMLAGALPGGWHTMIAWVRKVGHLEQVASRPFARSEWLMWLLWALVSAGLAYAAYTYPAALAAVLDLLGTTLPETAIAAHLVRILGAIIAPPVVVVGIWMILGVLAIAGGLLFGSLRGAWRSFFR